MKITFNTPKKPEDVPYGRTHIQIKADKMELFIGPAASGKENALYQRQYDKRGKVVANILIPDTEDMIEVYADFINSAFELAGINRYQILFDYTKKIEETYGHPWVDKNAWFNTTLYGEIDMEARNGCTISDDIEEIDYILVKNGLWLDVDGETPIIRILETAA